MHMLLKDKRGRASLSTFKSGNITLEAAIVTPIFLFVIVSIMYFMVIIYIQLCIQTGIEEIADDLTTEMYAVEAIQEKISEYEALDSVEESSDKENDSSTENDMTDSLITETSVVENIESNISSLDISDDVKSLIKTGITSAYLYGKLTGKLGYEQLNNTYIVNGAAGLSMTDSEIDIESGIGDIIVSYKIKIPFLSDNTFTLPFTQRCRFKFWTGESLTNEDAGNIVYITENGTVYHTDLTCYHLNVSVSKTTYGDVSSKRNTNGAKYTKCAYCCKDDLNDSSIVYITDSGTKYHSSLGCSGLKRGIITIDISDVGDMPGCSNCVGSEESDNNEE